MITRRSFISLTGAAALGAAALALPGTGFSIAGATAQNSRDETRSAVNAWLG